MKKKKEFIVNLPSGTVRILAENVKEAQKLAFQMMQPKKDKEEIKKTRKKRKLKN